MRATWPGGGQWCDACLSVRRTGSTNGGRLWGSDLVIRLCPPANSWRLRASGSDQAGIAGFGQISPWLVAGRVRDGRWASNAKGSGYECNGKEKMSSKLSSLLTVSVGGKVVVDVVYTSPVRWRRCRCTKGEDAQLVEGLWKSTGASGSSGWMTGCTGVHWKISRFRFQAEKHEFQLEN